MSTVFNMSKGKLLELLTIKQTVLLNISNISLAKNRLNYLDKNSSVTKFQIF